MALFSDWKSRLREAAYISPSLQASYFITNTLERSGGKKASTQEILDSDESITQDQGNKAYVFKFDAYFTGEDYDKAVDSFVKLLEERHTLLEPGILQHPRWGDINVFPTDWSQKEELINGAQIGHVDVTFVEVFPPAYPVSDGADVLDGMDGLETIEPSFATELASAVTNIAGKIENAVGIITTALETVTAGIEAVEDTMTAIQSTIDGLIDDVGGNIFLIISATQRLIRTPSRIIDSSMDKINVYKDMITDLCDTFFDPNETDPVNIKNNAIMLEFIGGFALATLTEAVVFTDYSIRSQATSAIEAINDSLQTYNDTMALSSGSGYSGDHNFYSILMDLISGVNSFTLNNAFDLKAEKKFVLKNNSDAITLCYENYGTVSTEQMEFFINTNKLIENEFLEISVGREITVYL
jgi:hypothetical protein